MSLIQIWFIIFVLGIIMFFYGFTQNRIELGVISAFPLAVGVIGIFDSLNDKLENSG